LLQYDYAANIEQAAGFHPRGGLSCNLEKHFQSFRSDITNATDSSTPTSLELVKVFCPPTKNRPVQDADWSKPLILWPLTQSSEPGEMNSHRNPAAVVTLSEKSDLVVPCETGTVRKVEVVGPSKQMILSISWTLWFRTVSS